MQYNLTDAIFKKGQCAEKYKWVLSDDKHASTNVMATEVQIEL